MISIVTHSDILQELVDLFVVMEILIHFLLQLNLEVVLDVTRVLPCTVANFLNNF